MFAFAVVFEGLASEKKNQTDLKNAEVQKRLQSLPLVVSFTKKSKDFQVKNLFPFRLPDNLPPTVNFRGLSGSVSTTTRWKPGSPHLDFSETLFSLGVPTSASPAWAEPVGYPDLFTRFPNQGLWTSILKQPAAGTTTISCDFVLPVGMPMKSNGVFLAFDGSDFAGEPYTMTGDLHVL